MDYVALIKDRLRVSTLIGEFVTLKNAGTSIKGLCPFHSEKTPSFSVDDGKGFYHCFGCGASGDIFTFVQQFHGLDFKEALRFLAPRAGVILPERVIKPASTNALGLLKNAGEWFRRQIIKDVSDYLNQRSIDSQLQSDFDVGYAPAEGLYKHLLDLGHDKQLIFALGLCRKADHGGVFDFFQNRIIFPIKNKDGDIIGFGGRAMTGQEPKYLNSIESSVFKKSYNLYNQERITESERVFVVEGYTDVIAMKKRGYTAVAPLGTALTRNQLQSIWAAGCTPILCFDGDSAGRRATKKAVQMATLNTAKKTMLEVVLLPPGQDPCGLMSTKNLDNALSKTKILKWHEFLQKDVKIERVLLNLLFHFPGILERRGEEVSRLELTEDFGAKVLNILVDQTLKGTSNFKERCREELVKVGLSELLGKPPMLQSQKDADKEVERLIVHLRQND